MLDSFYGYLAAILQSEMYESTCMDTYENIRKYTALETRSLLQEKVFGLHLHLALTLALILALSY